MKTIYWFTSRDQLEKVINKLEEYEGIKCNFSYSWNETAWIVILWWWDIVERAFYEDEYQGKLILAEDYLHPVKLWDRVEVQDDSEYNGNIYTVTCVWDDDDFKLEHAVHETIWRHQDVLQALKEEPKRLFKKDDRVKYIWKFQSKFKSESNYFIVEIDQEYIHDTIKLEWESWTVNHCNLELQLTNGNREEPCTTWLDCDEAYTTTGTWIDKPVQHISTGTLSGSDNIWREGVEELIREAVKDKVKECNEYINVIYPDEKKAAVEYFNNKWYKIWNHEVYNSETDNFMQDTDACSIYINRYGEIDWTYYIEGDLPDGKIIYLKDIELNNLNTNNKTMNTIEREAYAIATEEYFDDKKVIKAIRSADAEMVNLLDILDNAMEEITKKRSRLNGIHSNFNRNYSENKMDTVKAMLSNHKEVKEFIMVFINSKVSDFIKDITEETFNAEEVFNR